MHTKIIVTYGPKLYEKDTLKKMIKEGVDILRINFSHASHEQYSRVKKEVAKINKDLKKEVAIMADLQGPRIRVGKTDKDGILLKEGEVFTFSYKQETNAGKRIVHLDDPYLHIDIKKGEPFYLANGDLELEVIGISKESIKAEVKRGGILYSYKGVNVPRTNLRRSGLTTEDEKNAKFVLKEGVDFIALSFVQSAEDVLRLKKYIGKKSAKIIAKIERSLALDKIDEIIQAADGIMVARGDLGIEIPMEQLPIVQKNLVRHAHWHGKPAIIATQMMTSMINHEHPTRAEVSDIANAIFDGADGVMLSDETAVGSYPIKTVELMKKIVTTTEKYLSERNFLPLNN